MKSRISKYILGVYDLIIVINVLKIGIPMIMQTGVYAEYPVEWLTRVPFENYVLPGVIGIVTFGIGNLIASGHAFIKHNRSSWIPSMVMGCILLIAMIMQVMLLGESYLVTGILILVSILQLILSFLTAMLVKQKGNNDET